MTLRSLEVFAVLLILHCGSAAPAEGTVEVETTHADAPDSEKDDLKTAASNYAYPDRYSDWGRYQSGYGGTYGATGYGTVDRYNYASVGNYDNSYGYNRYPSYSGYSGGSGYTGGTGYGGYSGGTGYSGYDYTGNRGNGGYGGYSGNGGLNSYYGYNNPYHQGSNHLGYGYYKRTGTGNIYNSGITPNSVTGYRGYSRK